MLSDLERFNKDLKDLLEGKKVQLPRYNFITGKSEAGEITQIEKNQPIILEGIHGLNPVLTMLQYQMTKNLKFI